MSAAAGNGSDPTVWQERGPRTVLKGLAANAPEVSGRANDIAVSGDGQRVYVATSNGGVWRSKDAGHIWEPLMRGWDENPQTVTKTPELEKKQRGLYHGSDSLACGAIALVDGSAAASDRLFVGSGEAYAGLDSYFGVGPLTWSEAQGKWKRETATPTLTGFGCYQMAVDPTRPDTVYTATRRGLYKRLTSASWRKESLGDDRYEVTTVVIARKKGADIAVAYAATSDGQVFKKALTHPSPSTWDPIGRVFTLEDPTKPKRITLAVQRDNPDALYALTERGKIAGQATWGKGRVYRWGGGTTWHPVEGLPPDDGWNDQGHWNLALAVDPRNKNRIFVGMASVQVKRVGSRRKKVSAGALYQCDVNAPPAKLIGDQVHADIHALVFGDDDTLWVACDGGVFKAGRDALSETERKKPASEQAALKAQKGFDPSSFTACNHGLATLTLEHLGQHPTDPDVFYCGSQDNGCLRHAEGKWEHFEEADSGVAVVNWHAPDEILISASRTKLWIKTVGGNATGPKEPPSDTRQVEFYPPLAGTPYNPYGETAADEAKRVAFGTDRVWISEDFGDTWSAISGSALPSGRTDREWLGEAYKSLVFANARMLYAGTTKGSVYRFARDRQGEWTKVALSEGSTGPIPRVPVTSIAVDRADETGHSIYITLAGEGGFARVWHHDGTRWRRKHGGSTADNRLLPVQHNAIVVHPDDPRRLYVGADIGVWYSPDGGANWQTWASGLPDAAVLDLKIWPPPGPVETGATDPTPLLVPHRIRASTHGRGLFERPIDTPLQKRIEVVFVLDATGSMRDLIETAKKEIRGIAEDLKKVKGGETPEIRVGLIRYRDRTDAEELRLYAFTDDLHEMNRNLASFEAKGGDDIPESVNRALYEALNTMAWQWGPDVYRVIFLVGDAPPHMEREHNVYETARAAAAKDIAVNTVLCGTDETTATIWKEIAKHGRGHYHVIPPTGDEFRETVHASIRAQAAAKGLEY